MMPVSAKSGMPLNIEITEESLILIAFPLHHLFSDHVGVSNAQLIAENVSIATQYK
jgi:hypothetical protein